MNDHQIAYTDEELDDILDAVFNKTVYGEATGESHGLMSTEDKEKLDGIRPISNEEIAALFDEMNV